MALKPFALAVRLLLFNEDGKVLLLRRSQSSKTNPGTWELPGGKIDAGEPFDAALAREMREETGLAIRLHHAAGTAEQHVQDWHVVHLIMTGTVVYGSLRISREHDEFMWAGIDEMRDLELADWFREYLAKSSAITAGKGQE